MDAVISYGCFQCRELSPHKNRGMEITYIERGLLEWMVEGVSERVEPGTIYFTLPWQVHGSVNPREPDNLLWHILFHLDRDYFSPHAAFRFPKELGFSPNEERILSSTFAGSRRHGFPATPTLRTLMPALIGELQGSHELREAHVKTMLRALLVELKRVVAGETTHATQCTRTEKLVMQLIAALPENCGQPWTLSQMAEACGVQRTRLNTIFMKLTGATPMEYLFRIRMERAKTLLRETDLRVTDIALDCGYGTSQYFANTFRKATGFTPSGYRKQVGHLASEEFRNWKNVQFRSEEEERQRVEAFSATQKQST